MIFHEITLDKRKTIISVLQAITMLRKGYLAYLVYLKEQPKYDKKLRDVEVVWEFADIFPDELPRLPPDRKIEFTIDLEPQSTPVSRAPYRMVPEEVRRTQGPTSRASRPRVCQT